MRPKFHPSCICLSQSSSKPIDTPTSFLATSLSKQHFYCVFTQYQTQNNQKFFFNQNLHTDFWNNFDNQIFLFCSKIYPHFFFLTLERIHHLYHWLNALAITQKINVASFVYYAPKHLCVLSISLWLDLDQTHTQFLPQSFRILLHQSSRLFRWAQCIILNQSRWDQ